MAVKKKPQAPVTERVKKYRIVGLEPKAADFVIAYLEEGRIVARAARRVKISEEQGYALFSRPDVQEAIDRQLRRVREKFEINIEHVIRELALIGFARMGDYTRVDGKGQRVLALADCTDEELAAVASIETDVEELYEGHGKNREQIGVVKKTKFKLHDKQAALVNLRRHLGGLFDAKKDPGDAEEEDKATSIASRIRDAMVEIDETTGKAPELDDSADT